MPNVGWLPCVCFSAYHWDHWTCQHHRVKQLKFLCWAAYYNNAHYSCLKHSLMTLNSCWTDILSFITPSSYELERCATQLILKWFQIQMKQKRNPIISEGCSCCWFCFFKEHCVAFNFLKWIQKYCRIFDYFQFFWSAVTKTKESLQKENTC